MTEEKLQKVLARAGLGSRRVMESYIAAGRVEVNGKTAQLGDRVAESAKIRVDGRLVTAAALAGAERQVIAYHKPTGEVVSQRDPEGPENGIHSPAKAQGRPMDRRGTTRYQYLRPAAFDH